VCWRAIQARSAAVQAADELIAWHERAFRIYFTERWVRTEYG
jgi:hypothetical protein